MAEFLQQVFLNDIVLFAMMGVVMLLITSWAYSMKEYAGYILGWLMGVLLMILMSVFSTRSATSELPATTVIQGPFVMVGLIVAAFTGLGFGFGALALAGSGQYRASKVRRALAVAFTTGFTLTAGYLMLISGYAIRLVIVVFTLAVAIGALMNYILSRRRRRSLATPADVIANPEAQAPEYPMGASDASNVNNLDVPSPLAQRIHNLHNRMGRRDLE